MLNKKSLLGYTNKLTVRPGEEIEFKVSAKANVPYHAQLVRLINGDTQSSQANFKEEDINSSVNGEYTGLEQPIHQGSCVVVNDVALLNNLEEFTILLTFMPTTPAFQQQHLLSRWDEGQKTGWSLHITAAGQLCFMMQDEKRRASTVVLPGTLKSKQWYRAVVRVGRLGKPLHLDCFPAGRTATHQMGMRPVHGHSDRVCEWVQTTVPLMMAAAYGGCDSGGRVIPAGCFNGRIEAPVIYKGILTDIDVARVFAGERPLPLQSRLIGDWDFARGIGGTDIYDRSPNNLRGHTHNLPARAIKGCRWDGTVMNWTQRPAHYAAIHFHSDDLYDCGWQTSVMYCVDEGVRSGVYALRLQQGAEEEYLPFFVAAPKGKPSAKLAFIIPTFTYLAYGNTHVLEISRTDLGISRQDFYEKEWMGPATEHYSDQIENNKQVGLSTYDRHLDGSPVHYSSWLRPLLNMRPKSVLWNLGADLLLTDWLEAKGITYDVITDDLLEKEGVRLLKDYRVVMSGNHPEYPTTTQLDALQTYTEQGGRFMYMGGNGYYWHAAVHEILPGVLEVRRGRIGTTHVASETGEAYLEFSGEMGGLCREIGRPPQQLVGVGFCCDDDGVSSYYRVMPDARQGRAAFILEGITEDVIGDFGVMGGGAAGREFDSTKAEYGTPGHAIVVARSENHDLPGDYYVIEERILDCGLSEEFCRSQICAEVVFFETPNGGAVFSVGSMTWAGSLSHNNYDNNISRMTLNVLERFLDSEPFSF